MSHLSWVVLIVLVSIQLFNCHNHGGDDHGKATQNADQGGNHKQNPIRDSKHMHNVDHIKEHLQEVVEVKDDQVNDGNLQFHYFKVHDSDGDDKLDGIELANAMSHYHDEENGGKEADYSEDEIASMVDQILEEDDSNHDGFIDYPEFVASQERTD